MTKLQALLAETGKVEQLSMLLNVLKIAETRDRGFSLTAPNPTVMLHTCRSDEQRLEQQVLGFEEVAWRNHFCYLAECEHCGRIFLSSKKTRGYLWDHVYFDAAHEAVHRDWRARQLSAGQPLKRDDFCVHFHPLAWDIVLGVAGDRGVPELGKYFWYTKKMFMAFEVVLVEDLGENDLPKLSPK